MSQTAWTQIEIAENGPADATVVLAFVEGSGATRFSADPDCLAALAQSARFEAKAGRWLDVLPAAARGERTLLLGVGTSERNELEHWAGLGGNLLDAMNALRLSAVRLPQAGAFGGARALEAMLLGVLLHGFRYATGRKTADPEFRPERLVIDPADTAAAEGARRTAQAVNRARAWVEAPANRLTPAAWAEELRDLATPGVVLKILDPAALEALGAAALLAVGRGAENEPHLAVVEWRGAREREGWDAVLVGKGLTFDGGGLNLKVRPTIEKMKFDMGGGAAVLGAVELAASRQARCNVAAVVPMAENAIDAKAYRPGDVIGSLAGLTIEVLNTDAEGRLVVADGVTYARQIYDPAYIIDVATLTGSITGVLHEEFAAIYANDDGLAEGLREAGETTGEHVWRMPLAASQDYLVESAVADVANLGAPGLLGAGFGSPAAGAKLIEKFAGDSRWAHIDIAGTAWATRRTPFSNKGATGFGVRLLDQWLRRLEASGADQLLDTRAMSDVTAD